jgi:hypothetical protein
LGDEILFEGEASESGEVDILLLATVLFELAAQQRNEQAMESFERVLELDAPSSAYKTQDDFLSSFVVKVAEAACRLPL